MVETSSLNGVWQLHWAEGRARGLASDYVHESCGRGDGIDSHVPEPVQAALERAGLVGDPTVGLNSLAARWAEDMYWIYRRTFNAPADAVDRSAWLVFDCLDLDAEVWLNGTRIGTSENANIPFRCDASQALRSGINHLAVVVSTGWRRTVDLPQPAARHDMEGRLRRTWKRHPQYTCGWDWNPRLVPIGILGDVTFAWGNGPCMAQLACVPLLNDDRSEGTVLVRPLIVQAANAEAAVPVRLTARILGTAVAESMTFDPSDTPAPELCLALKNPDLWWPIHHGDQSLYTVEVALTVAGHTETVTRRVGFRHVRIDQSPHPSGGTGFALVINGRPIFCKGGNLVPPSLFWSDVGDDTCRRLVDMALDTNANMLRVWGGGTWAYPALCDACDEAGVMIWHDLLFACNTVPGGHDDAFRADVARESAWGMRERAHHPSIVVWCGNNEVDQNDPDRCKPGTTFHNLFLTDLAEVAAREAPHCPWWPASPHSPAGLHPNDPDCGDQHPWGVTLGSFKEKSAKGHPADFWLYRRHHDRFPNEGGVLGASPVETLRRFLPARDLAFQSPAWKHHDNFHGGKSPRHDPGGAPVVQQIISLWTGLNPQALPLEDYVFFSMLLQAEGLTEYIRNFRRRMFDSAAAVYWMFNDSWPCTHSWPVFDFYFRRKLAFHPVRRACAPITVIVAEEDDGEQIGVYGVNETPAPWHGTLTWGLFSLDGARRDDRTAAVALPPNTSTRLAGCSRNEWTRAGTCTHGMYALLHAEDGTAVAQHRLFVERFGDLAFVSEPIAATEQDGRVVFECPVFAWGVTLDPGGQGAVADDVFDLLPGVPYSVPAAGIADAAASVVCGSEKLLASRSRKGTGCNH